MRLRSEPTAASQRSFWLKDALSQDPSRSHVLRSRLTADVCIVGGGYTGLWTAIELKQRDPGIDVVLLEAQLCGSGASGTNAGILMNLWPKFPALARLVGHDDAVRLATHSARAVEDIVAFCAEHAIEADVRRSGWLWTSTSPDQDGAWKDTMTMLADVAGCPLESVSREQAAELAGTAVRGGVFDPGCATLQPAVLARGLRRVAIELGVRLHENTPVRAVTGDGPITVETPHGAVRADSVVLAINAWASSIPSMRRHLVMTASDNVVTAPLDPALLDHIGRDGAAASDSRRLLNYWRSTADGRLLFGKGGVGLGYRGSGASSMFGPVPRRDVLLRHYARTFPEFTDVPIAATWRAPVEYSLSSLPFFTRVPGQPRVFIGTGYSGDGVGPSRLGGRILASLATNAKDEWSECGLTRPPSGWLPPEPIRFLGGQMVRLALIRSDDARDTGRKIDPMTAALSRLDPTSWV